MARVFNGNIIIKDSIDNKYYLNYLNYLTGVGSAGLGNQSFTFDSFYEQAMQNSLNVIAEANDYDVIAKHKWHINYLKIIKEYNDNLPEMSEKDFVELVLRNNERNKSTQNGV
jgi:hypothetical protein